MQRVTLIANFDGGSNEILYETTGRFEIFINLMAEKGDLLQSL